MTAEYGSTVLMVWRLGWRREGFPFSICLRSVISLCCLRMEDMWWCTMEKFIISWSYALYWNKKGTVSGQIVIQR